MSLLCLSNALNTAITVVARFMPRMSTVRHKFGRENCIHPFDLRPPCSPKNIQKTECMMRKKERIEKRQEDHKFKHLIAKPECCMNPCPNIYPRFDALYYVETDKLAREYQQTWCECPKAKKVPKPYCKFEKLDLAEIEFRKRKSNEKLGTACEFNKQDFKGLMPCKRKDDSGCPRMNFPRCKGGRIPPTCYSIRRPTNCKKICTPYPAFSECQPAPTKPKGPVECDCLRGRSMCTLFSMIRAGLLRPIKKKKY